LANRKKRPALLLAQRGYITERRCSLGHTINEPAAAASPWSMPSTARWRLAVDRAARLLQSVSEQMQAYSDGRTQDWHAGRSADCFHENLEQINELQAQIDDLRSNF
jgi:hypothetical protein